MVIASNKKLFLIVATIAAAIIYCACKEENPAPLPAASAPPAVADFTFEITNRATRKVQFTNTSTYAENYLWSFGDNTISSAASPQHAYAGNGDYYVMLVAYGSTGIDTIFRIVSIRPF